MPRERVYDIQFNGDTPYRVRIFGKNIQVYNKCEHLVLKCVAQKIFIPDKGLSTEGNTILILLRKTEDQYKYLYIGNIVYTFTTTEPITRYTSDIGNSAVPYPIGISRKTYYMIAEAAAPVPKNSVPDMIDIYDIFYNNRDSYRKHAKGYKVIFGGQDWFRVKFNNRRVRTVT